MFKSFLVTAILIAVFISSAHSHDLPNGDEHDHGVLHRDHFHRIKDGGDSAYSRILANMTNETTVGQELTNDNINLVIHLWRFHGEETMVVMSWLIGSDRPLLHHNESGSNTFRGNRHTSKSGHGGKHVHIRRVIHTHSASESAGIHAVGQGDPHGHNTYEKSDGSWTWHGIPNLEYTRTYSSRRSAPAAIPTTKTFNKKDKLTTTWASLKSKRR